MKCRFLMIAATLLLADAAHSNGSRLTVLNELIDPVSGAESTFELYLSRLGTYYAELYFEAVANAAAERQNTLDLALTISFVRSGRLVARRDVELQLPPGKNVMMLFSVDSPYDLPQRKNLDVLVEFHAVDADLRRYYDSVRLQLTRKLKIVPLMF